MFKVYSPKFNIFVYAFNIHDKPSRDIKLFCPYCTHTSECDGVSFVKEHYKSNRLWKSHFRRSRYCKYKNELPKTSEGESAEHLNMKLDVLEYFKNLECECDLEVRIGNNICDVVAELDDTKIAIECQISNISHKEVRSRTDNYIKHGYTVLWLTVPNSSFVVGRAAAMSSVQKTIYKIFGRIWTYDFLYVDGEAERAIWEVRVDEPTRSGYTVVRMLSKFLKVIEDDTKFNEDSDDDSGRKFDEDLRAPLNKINDTNNKTSVLSHKNNKNFNIDFDEVLNNMADLQDDLQNRLDEFDYIVNDMKSLHDNVTSLRNHIDKYVSKRKERDEFDAFLVDAELIQARTASFVERMDAIFGKTA